MEKYAVIIPFIRRKYKSYTFSTIYIVSVVLTVHLAGLVLPGKWALPIFNTCLFFHIFYFPVSRGEYAHAVKLSLIWAVATIILQVWLSSACPELMEEKIFRGASYRAEMFHWVRTGEGPEGNISLFLPVHIRHFLVFCLVSAVSGGFFGLLMGSVLLGYMDFYVGCLISSSGWAGSAIAFSWPVWSIIRVVGYIIAGTALGGLLLDRHSEKREKKNKMIRLMILAVILVLVDILLKWQLAGTYQSLLHSIFQG